VELLESSFVRPRQARYQAALRPDMKCTIDSKALSNFTATPIRRIGLDCARMGYCNVTVHIGAAKKTSAAAGAVLLACRLSLASASRFICDFICEYFLKTCAPLWRSIWVTHSSATPPALSRAT
jgi:hypothetical protein